MSTLQEAAEALKPINSPDAPRRARKARIVSAWLGRFHGVIPSDKTSTDWIRELRRTLYGKSR